MSEEPSAAPEAAPPIPAPPPPPAGPRPRDAAAVVAAVTLYAAVTGVHVLGLLAGRASFSTTRQIEADLPGLSLLAAPSLPAAAPTARFVAQLTQVGATPWLRALTVLSVVLAIAAVGRLMQPGLAGRVRRGEVAPFRLAVALGLTLLALAAAFWPLPPEVRASSFPLTRAVLTAGLLWLLWHPRGWLHSREQPPSYLLLLGLFVLGGAVGWVAFAFLRQRANTADLRVLDQWLGGGLYSDWVWRQLSLYAVASRAWGGLLLGLLVAALAPSGVGLRRRAWLLVAPLLGVALFLGAAEAWRRTVWVEQHGYGRELAEVLQPEQDGGPRQPELVGPTDPANPAAPPDRADSPDPADRTGPPRPQGPPADQPGARRRPPSRALVVLEGPRMPLLVSRAPAASVVGLPLDEPTRQRARALVAEAGGRSTLAYEAAVLEFDAAAWSWQAEPKLRAELAQLQSPAHMPIFGALLLETLGQRPRLPLAEQTLDRLLDGRSWRLRDKEALAAVAEVARRWGRYEAIEPRLRRAWPEAHRRLAAAPVPRGGGAVRGVLHRQGRPWAGVEVGLVPWERRRALQTPLVLPWPQRLVVAGATTDARGAFEIRDALAEPYALVLRLRWRALGFQEPFGAFGRVGPVDLGKQLQQDLGVIDFQPVPSSPLQQARQAGPGRGKARV